MTNSNEIYNLREKYHAFFDEIANNQKIKFKAFRSAQGIKHDRKDDAYVERIYSMHQGRKFLYPKQYNQITTLFPSELRWDWGYGEAENRVSGIVHLYNLSTNLHGAFNVDNLKPSGKGRIYFSDEAPPIAVNYGTANWQYVSDANKPVYEQARYFDAYQQGGLYTCILQKFNAETNLPEYDFDDLWLLHEDEFQAHQLDLTLEEYFDMLYLTKGALFWQYLFVKNAGEVTGDYELSHIMLMLTHLPDIFPDHNYAPLFQRFEKEFSERLAQDEDLTEEFTQVKVKKESLGIA